MHREDEDDKESRTQPVSYFLSHRETVCHDTKKRDTVTVEKDIKLIFKNRQRGRAVRKEREKHV